MNSKRAKKNSAKAESQGIPVSRRGVLAALATFAGLGILDSFAPVAEAYSVPGIWCGWTSFGTHNILTHRDRTQGNNDSYCGKMNNPLEWSCNAIWYGSAQWYLKYAFGMVYQCDYSNELYDHIVFLPYFFCGSKSSSGAAGWKGEYDGDDNKITCKIDGHSVGYTKGNLIDEDRHFNRWENGWRIHDVYQTGYYHQFVRREANQRDRRLEAYCELFNIYANFESESWQHRTEGYGGEDDVCAPCTQYAPSYNDNINLTTEKIYLENDTSLYGGIFKLHPWAHPKKHLDLGQGKTNSAGQTVTAFENGRTVCIWDNYESFNSLWLMKPFNDDGVGAFTFALASLAGPGLTHCLNNEGHDTPKTDGNHNVLSSVANIWEIGSGSAITKSWWVGHEPSVSNETDHKCWFLTSDGDGQRLDLNGGDATNGRQLGVSGWAKPGEWAGQTNAQWDFEEARTHGSISLNKTLYIPGDEAKCFGWKVNGDDKKTLLPNSYAAGVANESELPPYPMYRWYGTDEPVEIEADDDARIIASCAVSTWGQQKEAYAHRHIGYPHGGNSIYNLALRIEGSKFSGSICYAAENIMGEWSTGVDGSAVCTDSAYAIGRVKLWLTGDIAENYDLEYRGFIGGIGWTDPVYSTGRVDDDGSDSPTVGNGAESWYTIWGDGDFVLDVVQGVANAEVNGTNVQAYTSNRTLAQRFVIHERPDGYVEICNFKSYCIDAASSSIDANVQLYQSNGTDAQLWKMESVTDDEGNELGVTFKNKRSNGYLTATGAAAGSNVKCAAAADGWTRQLWTLTSVEPANNDKAPTIGKLYGLNVHLVRKPKGAKVLKEFGTSHKLDITADFGCSYLYCAAMIGLRTVARKEKYVWTDRLLGTVISEPARLTARVHFMLVDTLGDIDELYTVDLKPGTEFTVTDFADDFDAADEALRELMNGEGQDMSLLDSCMDRWYEGDKGCTDPSIFGNGKFTSKKLQKDLYLWVKVIMGQAWFFKDGCSKENLIFKSPRFLKGTIYTFPTSLAEKELESTCNLNDRFGTDPSTGFTGWHLDKELSDEAVTSYTVANTATAFYGRNRCTLRCEYAPGSVVLSPDWDMRVAPEASAEAHPGFIPTFTEPTHKGYDAKGKEFALAPIADSGEGHTAYYFDELARVTVPATAYRNIGGGQWRTYQCEAWLDDGEATAASVAGASRSRSRARAANAFKMTKDTVKYIRWTEVVSDGVVGVRRK